VLLGRAHELGDDVAVRGLLGLEAVELLKHREVVANPEVRYGLIGLVEQFERFGDLVGREAELLLGVEVLCVEAVDLGHGVEEAVRFDIKVEALHARYLSTQPPHVASRSPSLQTFTGRFFVPFLTLKPLGYATVHWGPLVISGSGVGVGIALGAQAPRLRTSPRASTAP